MLPEIFFQLPQNGTHTYLRYKNWFIKESLLHLRGTERMRALRHLPGLHNKQLFLMWRAAKKRKPSTLTLPFSYDAFQINDGAFRLRAFDIDQEKTIKVVLRNSRYGESTLRELQARSTFLQETNLKIPAVYESDSNDLYMRFSEEMLEGRAFVSWLDFPRFMKDVGRPLLSLCAQYGISQKPLAESMDADKVAKIMRCPKEDARIAKAQQLLEQNKMVATTIAHCDLVSSNMIVTKDGIYVVDWEKCKEMYAGYDFARLALRYPANPVFARTGRSALQHFQQNRLSLDDVRTLREAISVSHLYTV